ncbi:MAG: hypothetical protein LBD17_03340 [Endomicrobium sp.]|jgi:hypothetical protein|nr:hypothetical protein [Endomicrobium sp.]
MILIRLLIVLFFASGQTIHAENEFSTTWDEMTSDADTGKSPWSLIPNLPVSETNISVLIHNNVVFVMAELFRGKIIICDYLGDLLRAAHPDQMQGKISLRLNSVHKSLSSANPPNNKSFAAYRRILPENTTIMEAIVNGFIGKTINTLRTIYKNPIGRMLLNDLNMLIELQKASNEAHASTIVVFPCDFLDAFNKTASSKNIDGNSCFPEKIKPYLPRAIDLLTWHQVFNTAVKLGSCFNAKDDNWPFNTVLLKYSDQMKGLYMTGPDAIFSTGSSRTEVKDNDEINLSKNIPFTDDIIVFHEFNHARHFLKNIGTHSANSAVNNASSLGIVTSEDKNNECKMHSPEEELQLTGYTIINVPIPGSRWKQKAKPILDYVNETNYRIQSKMRIRFPYKGKDGSILGVYLKLLLNTSFCHRIYRNNFY